MQSPSTLGESPHTRAANWGCCNNLDPRTWRCNDKKVAQIAAAVLLICALALTACILIVQYPAASSAFITTFSIIGIGSFMALCISMVKHCRDQRAQRNLDVLRHQVQHD